MAEYGPESINTPAGGRRFYAHDYSFLELASGSTQLAFDVFGALASMRSTRTIESNVEMAVQDLGLFTEPEAAKVMEWHVEHRDLLMGGLLRACGYAPKIPYKSGPIRQVLGDAEVIDRSCHADGYNTMAFRNRRPRPWYLRMSPAASRMYIDNDRIPELTSSLANNGEPIDLELLRGNNLFYLESLTPEQRQRRSAPRQADPLSISKLSTIDKQCRLVYKGLAIEKLEEGWIQAMMVPSYRRHKVAGDKLDKLRTKMLMDIARAASITMQFQSLESLEK